MIHGTRPSAASGNVCPGNDAARCRSRAARASAAPPEVYLHFHGVTPDEVAAIIERERG